MDANSIGYNEVKGKNAVGEDGVKDLNDLDLWEVSTVSFPSNEAATVDEVKGMEPDELEFKAAIGYKKTPLAPEGQAWDGPGQTAAADVTDLRAMCACIVGDPANKTSYKLPHHMAGGGHSCVWAGVAAAYAATQGSRGGVQGCDDAGVTSHLLHHYDDFGKTRPGKSMDIEETKAGRVLSGSNAQDLTTAHGHIGQAHELIGGVLNKLQPATDEAAPTEKPAAKPAPGKALSTETDELRLKLSKLNEQLKGIL